MLPQLLAIEADPAADAAFLDRLAALSDAFSPCVAAMPPDGLVMDVSGVAHLFDGEEALMRRLAGRLEEELGRNRGGSPPGAAPAVRVAIASTPGAADAFARFGETAFSRTSAAELPAALFPLPVEALRLEADALRLLRRLGLRRIGDIAAAPRRVLAARAGEGALRRLDEALGRAPEALKTRRPPPAASVGERFPEPLIGIDMLLQRIGGLCGDLARRLEERGLGVRRLGLRLITVDGRPSRLLFGFSRAERRPGVMMGLIRERLTRLSDRLDAPFGVEAVGLDALAASPARATALELAPSDGRDRDAEARFIDVVVARLGTGTVLRPAPRDRRLPEAADGWAPPGADRRGTGAPPPADGVMRRPLRLMTPAQPVEVVAALPDGPPARMRWRRTLRRITRAEGPERIAPAWTDAALEAAPVSAGGRGPPARRERDYYRIEDDEGRRYWVYREDARPEEEGARPPRWYVQGLFA